MELSSTVRATILTPNIQLKAKRVQSDAAKAWMDQSNSYSGEMLVRKRAWVKLNLGTASLTEPALTLHTHACLLLAR